jgi:thioester reductase-like protein
MLSRINVIGTKNVLEFAHEARQLRRLCHWSTAFVAGKRKGIILEEELEEGQSFHNAYEESKYEAEVSVRHAQKHLPITVFRPSVIVGDSKRGEIGPYDGPYDLIATLRGRGFPLSFSGTDSAPCHLVPVDYVVDAACELAADVRTAGATFHLTDPNPLPVRVVCGLVTSESGSRSRRVPAAVARTLFRAPGLERFTRSIRPFLEAFSETCFFNTRMTAMYLNDADITCPPFDSYVEELVRFSRQPEADSEPSTVEEDTFDPLS